MAYDTVLYAASFTNHAAIPSLLEQTDSQFSSAETMHRSFGESLEVLKRWEHEFLGCGKEIYCPVPSSQIDSSIAPAELPKTCFVFLDVSQTNSLSHC
jgi:hypothetical protein